MKKIFLFSVLFFFVLLYPSKTFGQSEFRKMDGSWQGFIVNEKDTFVLVFDVDSESKTPVLMTFPYVAMEDVRPQGLRFANDTLRLSVSALAARIQLVYKNENEMDGFWIASNSKDTLSLQMQKTNHPLRINRPQTPKEPFPYSSEIIIVQNKKAKVSIEGTLTLPQGKGPFPCVILVTGSGPQDRNSEILMHKSFWVIADYLSRHGIAVFRYDERGVGKTTGNFSTSTSYDFTDDLLAVYTHLRKHKNLNKKQIGLAGHSEGGLVCAMAAAKNKNVGFYISLAGPAVRGSEILLEQSKQLFMVSGKDEEYVNFEYAFRKKIFEMFHSISDSQKFAEAMREYFEKTMTEISEEKAKEHNISKPFAEMWIIQLSSPWMKEFMSIDPANYLRKMKCPVLVMIGEKDFQVPHYQNLPIYENIFSESKHPNYTLLKMPQLNHLFQTANTGSISEYGRIEETFSPMALETMKDWILKTIKTN